MVAIYVCLSWQFFCKILEFFMLRCGIVASALLPHLAIERRKSELVILYFYQQLLYFSEEQACRFINSCFIIVKSRPVDLVPFTLAIFFGLQIQDERQPHEAPEEQSPLQKVSAVGRLSGITCCEQCLSFTFSVLVHLYSVILSIRLHKSSLYPAHAMQRRQ